VLAISTLSGSSAQHKSTVHIFEVGLPNPAAISRNQRTNAHIFPFDLLRHKEASWSTYIVEEGATAALQLHRRNPLRRFGGSLDLQDQVGDGPYGL
jgi:hypothetical protein